MNTAVLLLSVAAIAQAAPDWTHAGYAGLCAYVVVSLAEVWVQRPALRRHHDDCRDQLARLVDGQTALLHAQAELKERLDAAIGRIEHDDDGDDGYGYG